MLLFCGRALFQIIDVFAGLGLSIDAGSESDGEQPTEPEYKIEGPFETVLKNNMEQLQWTSLSVALLSASTALLAIAQDVPAHIMGSKEHLLTAQEALPNMIAFGVDMSEQVRPICRSGAASSTSLHDMPVNQ
jgi:hypothetical protein